MIHIKYFLLLFVLLLPLLVNSEVVDMVEDSNFNPHEILSDADLTDYNYLSQDDIQKFLDNRKGILKSYRVAVNGVDKSASQIIHEASQEHKINAEFILALLQKEQSLLDDTSPSQYQLDWATGYSKCDGCNGVAAYKGFSQQVYHSAARFRYYLDNPEQFKVSANKTFITLDNFIIIPKNKSTATLYIYNPWRGGVIYNGKYVGANYNFYKIWDRNFRSVYPDQSLLHERDTNKYWLIENKLRRGFVGTEVLMALYDQNLIQQSRIVPERKLSVYPIGAPITFNYIYSGVYVEQFIPDKPWALDKSEAVFKFKNLGKKTWTNDDVTLHLSTVAGAKSIFYDESWPDLSGGISSEEKSIAPGDVATFRVALNLNTQPGTYEELVKLKHILQSTTTMTNLAVNSDPSAKPQIKVKTSYFVESIEDFMPEGILEPGKNYKVTFVFKNASKINFQKNNLRLSAYGEDKKDNPFYTSEWRDKIKVAWLDQDVVKPGETGSYTFSIKAPTKRKLYKHSFELSLHQNNKQYVVAINNKDKINFITQVGKQDNTGRVFKDVENTDRTFFMSLMSPFIAKVVESSIPVEMKPGSIRKVKLVLKNTGNVIWNKGSLRLSSYDEALGDKHPKKTSGVGISKFKSPSWRDKFRVTWLDQESVKPGEQGSFTFTLQAPKKIGEYKHSFVLSLHDEKYNNRAITINDNPKLIFETKVASKVTPKVESKTKSKTTTKTVNKTTPKTKATTGVKKK